MRPGAIFEDMDKAAIGAIQYILKRSWCENVEFGGWIYECLGSYVFEEPTRGTQYGVERDAPHGKFGKVVGMYHTHGRWEPGKDVENFSGYEVKADGRLTGDKRNADKFNIPSYLGTSSGVVKRYTPKPNCPAQGAVDPVGFAFAYRRRDCR